MKKRGNDQNEYYFFHANLLRILPSFTLLPLWLSGRACAAVTVKNLLKTVQYGQKTEQSDYKLFPLIIVSTTHELPLFKKLGCLKLQLTLKAY